MWFLIANFLHIMVKNELSWQKRSTRQEIHFLLPSDSEGQVQDYISCFVISSDPNEDPVLPASGAGDEFSHACVCSRVAPSSVSCIWRERLWLMQLLSFNLVWPNEQEVIVCSKLDDLFYLLSEIFHSSLISTPSFWELGGWSSQICIQQLRMWHSLVGQAMLSSLKRTYLSLHI